MFEREYWLNYDLNCTRTFGCSGNNSKDNAAGQNRSDSVIRTESAADGTNGKGLPIPQELETIPEEYYALATQRGALIELKYDTYESKTYEQKTQKLQKRAIVYLPYGYSEDQKYNIFYLMHGGWGNEEAPLGTPNRPSVLKNVLDHGIAGREIEPLIIVCPIAYYRLHL